MGIVVRESIQELGELARQGAAYVAGSLVSG